MNRDHRVANYLLFGFSAICLVLLSLPLTSKVRSFRACVSYLLDPIPYYGGGAVERVADLPESAARLISGDVELHEALRRLQEAAIAFEEVRSLRAENERLRLAAGLGPAAGRRVRWAAVLQRDPVHWHRSIRIGAGSADGVKINAPVLGIHDGTLGVVGRITRVDEKTALVLLITDELSSVSARVSGGWEGLVQGRGSAKPRVNYLPVETEFKIGDEVRTSPSSAAFPPGLPVGSVSRLFDPDPFLAFQTVELRPSVPAAAISEVLILEPITEKTAGVREPEFLPPAKPKLKVKPAARRAVEISTAAASAAGVREPASPAPPADSEESR